MGRLGTKAGPIHAGEDEVEHVLVTRPVASVLHDTVPEASRIPRLATTSAGVAFSQGLPDSEAALFRSADVRIQVLTRRSVYKQQEAETEGGEQA